MSELQRQLAGFVELTRLLSGSEFVFAPAVIIRMIIKQHKREVTIIKIKQDEKKLSFIKRKQPLKVLLPTLLESVAASSRLINRNILHSVLNLESARLLPPPTPLSNRSDD